MQADNRSGNREIQQLQKRIQELERDKAHLEEKSSAMLNMMEDLEAARTSLCESEERYRALFTFSPDPLYVHVDNSVTLVNPAICQLLGADDPSQLIGKSVFEIVHPEYHENLRERWKLVFDGQPAPLLEEKFIRLDGTLVDVEVNAVAVDWKGSKGVQVMARDITQRKQTEEELRRREREFSTLVENAADMIVRFDANLRHIYCNSAVERQLGIPVSAILGKTPRELDGPKEQAEFIEKSLMQVLGTGQSQEVEQSYPTPSGVKHFLTRIAPERDGQGRIESLLAITRDITERKRVEETLRQSEERFKNLFMSMSDGFYLSETIYDDNGEPCDYRYLEVNPAFERIAGLNRDQIVGKRYKELVPANTTHWLDVYFKVERTGEPHSFEFYSAEYQMHFETYSYKSAKGQVTVIVRNITERKRAEERLLASETALQKINIQLNEAQRIAGIGSWTFNSEKDKPEWSEETYRIFGLDPKLGEPSYPEFRRLIHPSQWEQMDEAVNTAMSDGKGYSLELRVIRPDGSERIVRQHCENVPGDGGKSYILGTTLDITDFKRTQEAYSESERVLKNMIDTTPVGVGLLKGKVFWRVNAALCEMSGFSEKELLGQSMRGLYPNEEECKRTGGYLYEQMDKKGIGETETTFQRKDGSLYDVFLHLSPFDPSDPEAGVTATVMDITERKQAERLIHAQRDLAMKLGVIDDLQSGLKLCLDTVLNVSGMDSGGIYLADDNTGDLDLKVHHGLPAEFIEQSSYYGCNSPNARLVMSGKPMYGSYEQLDDRMKPVPRRKGLRGIGVIPLPHEGKSIGCINVASHLHEEVPEHARETLESIAAYIGGSIARLKAEENLRKSELRYRLLAENISDVVFTSDFDMKTTYVSPSVKNLLGYTYEEYLALPMEKRFTPRSCAQLMKNGKRGENILELECVRKDGGTIWAESKISPFYDEAGRVQGIIGVIRDIRERREAEERSRIYLHEQEVLAQASAAFVGMETTKKIYNYLGPVLRDETGADYVLISGRDIRKGIVRAGYIWGGPGFLKTWNRLTGINLRNFSLPLHRVDKEFTQRLLNHRLNLMPDGIRTILKGVIPDRKMNPVVKTLGIDSMYTMGFLWGENLYGSVVLGFKKGRTLSNARLAESVINQAAIVIQRRQAEDALHESEKRFRTMFMTADEGALLLNKELRIVMVNSKMSTMLGYTVDEILGRTPSDFMTPDGKQIYHTQICFRKKGAPGHYEQPYRRKDGSIVWVLVSASPLIDDKGRFAGSFGMFTDITDRKTSEEEKERLIKEMQSKNEELQAFTYTVSHDLKSPLVTVKGFLGMLQKDIASGNPNAVATSIHYISDAVNKMENLLRDLLDLSRVGRMVQPTRNIPYAQLTRETAQMLAGIIRERGVKLLITRDRTTVQGDPVRIKQLMLNLLTNAVKFMGDQPKPLIEVGVRHESGDSIFFVKDNGIGIDPRFHDKIFGLFDKLDPDTDGTGVGLAIVKRIIQIHNGHIWVESEGLGKGTTFCFTLPKG